MKNFTIGIDEAGRGPLAGPVAVAAVLIPKNLKLHYDFVSHSLRDSKKLSPKQRDQWFEIIQNHPHIHYAVSRSYPTTIDTINITQATNLAATRVLTKLIKNYDLRSHRRYTICLDGGLKIKKVPLNRTCHTIHTIIKGDEKISAIALASIVAKVTRDRYMEQKHKEYPHYHFNTHKGYGTKTHGKAIQTHGLCPLHRLTFTRKYRNM